MVIPNSSTPVAELDNDFDRDERLFHYTSSEGLYGILQSGCLWATHFRYLNDDNEFFAAKKSLKAFIEGVVQKRIAALKVSGEIELKDGVTINALGEHEAGVIVDSMYTATLKGAAPFVFSTFVCRTDAKDFQTGRLLHWATYGRNGGYAVQLNPHKLAKLIWGRKDNLLCQKVVYVGDEVPLELSQAYADIGQLAREMIDGILRNELEKIDVNKGGVAFMSIASRIKDSFFDGENEARVLSLRLNRAMGDYSPPKVHIRHSQGRAIPYIKLFEERLLGENCPIEAIVVGPHPDRERRMEALSLFLEAAGLRDISVVQSNVPYLGT